MREREQGKRVQEILEIQDVSHTAPKLVLNWPPDKPEEQKTKYVRVRFTYSVVPEGRGNTPEPERGWSRRYARKPVPGAANAKAPALASPVALMSSSPVTNTVVAAATDAIGGGASAAPAAIPFAATEKPKAPKEVQSLDTLLRLGAEIEALTIGDWYNARIDKILVDSRKAARVFVSWEQIPGVYEVHEGDQVEFPVRSLDGLWVYDSMRQRTGTEQPTAAPLCQPQLPVSSAKRELAMDGVPAATEAAYTSLVEGLHKGLNPIAGEDACGANKDAGMEDKIYGYYPGHPCYWPIFWVRSAGTKLTFTKVKKFPNQYKRLRVSHGVEGNTDAPRNSWMRDLNKERAERQAAGQPSPLLDFDSGKSSPAVAPSPTRDPSPPVLSRGTSDGVLTQPVGIRGALNADCSVTPMGAPLASEGGESVSPVVQEGGSVDLLDAEQLAVVREKLVHALALEDLTKSDLKDKFKVSKDVLKSLARPVKDGQLEKDKWKYKLLPAIWQEVQVDKWAEYTEDDRAAVRVRMARANADGGAGRDSGCSPVENPAQSQIGSSRPDDAIGKVFSGGSAGSAFEGVSADDNFGSRSSPANYGKLSKDPLEVPAITRKRPQGSSGEPSDRASKDARKDESGSWKEGSARGGSRTPVQGAEKDRGSTDKRRDVGRSGSRERDQRRSRERERNRRSRSPRRDRSRDRDRERDRQREREREKDRDRRRSRSPRVSDRRRSRSPKDRGRRRSRSFSRDRDRRDHSVDRGRRRSPDRNRDRDRHREKDRDREQSSANGRSSVTRVGSSSTPDPKEKKTAEGVGGLKDSCKQDVAPAARDTPNSDFSGGSGNGGGRGTPKPKLVMVEPTLPSDSD